MEELAEPRVIALGDDVDETVELVPGSTGIPIEPVQQGGLFVEPLEHGHGEAIVVAVAMAPDLAIADDRPDVSVAGALHQLVGNGWECDELSDPPGGIEGAALGAVAQSVGGLDTLAGGARGFGDHAALRQRVEEGVDSCGRPAVGAAGPVGANVPACVEGIFDQAVGEAT